MITVYHIPKHLIEDAYCNCYNDNLVPWVKANFDQYVKVAVVDHDDIDDAWEATNSVDQHWSLHPDIKETFGPRTRSSMVGDVFVIDGGCRMIVAPIGFISA